MVKKITIILFFVGSHLFSQTNKTFFLGHSLVNFNMPQMVNKLSIAGAKAYTYSVNVGNGANILYHWKNPTTGQGNQWKTTLPLGGFENFIITEAVPLKGQLQWSHTYRIADSLYRFAKNNNPNIQYYLYETWHCIKTGLPEGCPWDDDDALLWRPRLTSDLPKWEGIADSVNLIHTKDMLVIPAGQALAQLNDSITASKVPGITSINQLFSDDIHLTLTGNYFIACVMYGVIHKASPAGLPNRLTDEYGNLLPTYPTVTQAGIFQRIAWRTLCSYPRDGVNCLTTGIEESSNLNFDIFPNPSFKLIKIKTDTPLNLIITTIEGKLIYENSSYTNQEIEIENKGIYFIKASDINNRVGYRKLVITGI